MNRLPLSAKLQNCAPKSHRLKSPVERPADSLPDACEAGPSPECLRSAGEACRPVGGLRGLWEGLHASQSQTLWGVAAGSGILGNVK